MWQAECGRKACWLQSSQPETAVGVVCHTVWCYTPRPSRHPCSEDSANDQESHHVKPIQKEMWWVSPFYCFNPLLLLYVCETLSSHSDPNIVLMLLWPPLLLWLLLYCLVESPYCPIWPWTVGWYDFLALVSWVDGSWSMCHWLWKLILLLLLIITFSVGDWTQAHANQVLYHWAKI